MTFKTIIKLMDLKTLVAGTLPVLLGSVYSWYAWGEINLIYLILLTLAIILVQSSTNMINDYFDFKRGAENKNKEEEKALVSGEATPQQVKLIIILYQSLAFLIGVYIARQTSYLILLVAFVGFIIEFLYAFGPLPISYTPIGEIVSGLTMGIGITTTVIYIHSGVFSLDTILVAIPTSVFIGTILLSNNLSDMEVDRQAGRKTLPIVLGREKAEKLWVLSVILLLVLTFVLFLLNIYPIFALIATILLFPYKLITKFLSYEKSIQTKERTMAIIGKVGVKYHLAVIIGLIISIILKLYFIHN